MPTVEFYLRDLNALLGKQLSRQELEERAILFAKGEVERWEGDLVGVDIKDTNRPELWSVEGIARELRGHYGVEGGLPRLEAKSSGIEMRVEKGVETVRPKAVAAIVKGLTFDDASIKQAIQLQEKMAQTYGRNRSLVAIGVYDWNALRPPIRYTTVKPNGIKFIPLGLEEELTPAEILEKHPKGIEYGHLIRDFKEYPLMIDSAGKVLSMPPIINSARTGQITEDTKDVFIEVTGHQLERISVALNVFAAALAERGGSVESVRVVYPDSVVITPDFSPKKFELDVEKCNRILGFNLQVNEMMMFLQKARYHALPSSYGKIEAQYPAYRGDIMHQRDIMEDIAIAYELAKIPAEPPKLSTVGREDAAELFADSVRELMVGLGFQEILTFSLTNKDNLFARMNLKEESICEIANPVSSNWTALRNWLLPSLMEFLANNLHAEYPQRIFEVGDVVVLDEKAETRTRNVRKLACAISSGSAGYEEASSALDALMRNFGMEYKLKRAEHGSFIPGRAAEIAIGKKMAGVIGEIHPQVLNNWGLEKPVVAFEFELQAMRK